MPKITYIEHNGTEHVVDAEVGQTVMEAAIKNNIPGIEAECGGACACATCHIRVADEWVERVIPPRDDELDKLDEIHGADDNSRLSCQLLTDSAIDGLVVRLEADSMSNANLPRVEYARPTLEVAS